MDKTTIYLSEELRHRMASVAERQGRAQASVIREALEQYLETVEEPELTLIGVADEPAVSSENVRAYRSEWLDALTDDGPRH